MRSHNDSIDTTHTPPPLSFYNTFNIFVRIFEKFEMAHWKIKGPEVMLQEKS